MKIELSNIIKAYQGRTVLDIASLRLQSGLVYAVLGPNGSGKTTMFRLISAIEKADRGQIYYDGAPCFPGDRIVYLPQKPYLFDTTVLKNVMIALEAGTLSQKKAELALESLGMKSFGQARASSLSGGEAQKTALLRTLILGKELILLDEPTSAIDIPSVKLVEDYILKAVQDHQAALIFSTHNPSQAARMADEVIVLWEGRVIEKGPSERVLYYPQKQETKDFLEYWATGLNYGERQRNV